MHQYTYFFGAISNNPLLGKKKKKKNNNPFDICFIWYQSKSIYILASNPNMLSLKIV